MWTSGTIEVPFAPFAHRPGDPLATIHQMAPAGGHRIHGLGGQWNSLTTGSAPPLASAATQSGPASSNRKLQGWVSVSGSLSWIATRSFANGSMLIVRGSRDSPAPSAFRYASFTV